MGFVDAADPTTGYVAPVCEIDGLGGTDLRRIGDHILHPRHLGDAMRRVGPAKPIGSQPTCSSTDEHAPLEKYGVVALWPWSRLVSENGQYIATCARHFAAAVAAEKG